MAATDPAFPKCHCGHVVKAQASLFLYCPYTLTGMLSTPGQGPDGHWKDHRTPGHRARSRPPTSEEAILGVHGGDPPLQQARGSAELTVVLVEPPVGAAHGHVAGSAGLRALALGLAGLPAEPAPAPAAAQRLPAGGWRHIAAGKPCQTHKHGGSALGNWVGSWASSVARSRRGEQRSEAQGAQGSPCPSNGPWPWVLRAASACVELSFYGRLTLNISGTSPACLGRNTGGLSKRRRGPESRHPHHMAGSITHFGEAP